MIRLLVIEDDRDSREMLALLLEAGGYATTTVESEAAAVRALQLGGYDLVLADLMLGRPAHEASWSYIDRIVDLAKPAPVGVLSGWTGIERDAAAHGVVFALRKPASRQSLFEQLAATLRLPALAPETVAALQQYFACLASGEYEQFRSFLARDFTYRLPSEDARYANEVQGIDAFIEFTRATFEHLHDPRFELGAMRPLPRGALVEYVGSWTEDGQRRQMPGAVMFEADGGTLSRADVRVNIDELR